jgi:hypothetical protein
MARSGAGTRLASWSLVLTRLQGWLVTAHITLLLGGATCLIVGSILGWNRLAFAGGVGYVLSGAAAIVANQSIGDDVILKSAPVVIRSWFVGLILMLLGAFFIAAGLESPSWSRPI